MDDVQLDQYDPSILSEAEKKRFIAALGDGFGSSLCNEELDEVALPSEIEPGLLKHRAYYYKGRPIENSNGGETSQFWAKFDGYFGQGLSEQCPLQFSLERIRGYFLEQKTAYLRYATSAADFEHMKGLDPEAKADWERRIYCRALNKLYSKAWYEFHIDEQIFYIDDTSEECFRETKRGVKFHAGSMCVVIEFSGILGRLVEQYYWKFLLEKSAIRGEKTSQAAKSGGDIKASKQKRVREGWQLAAVAVWQEDPTRSKMTVAKIVKQRLKLGLSAKHISRVLTRP
jgi:hypothetical protein